mgnify:CR=1 FL=1
MTIIIPEIEVLDNLDFGIDQACEINPAWHDDVGTGAATKYLHAHFDCYPRDEHVYICDGCLAFIESETGLYKCLACGGNIDPFNGIIKKVVPL